jgi:OPT family oligopeptide transporter
MVIAACLSHVFLWYGAAILKQAKAVLSQSNEQGEDIHNRLMSVYPDVSETFFLVFLGLMIGSQLVSSIWTPFVLPIWAVFLSLAISIIFVLPIGMITAITGLEITLNVLSEFVIGLIIPGQTVPVMTFKSLTCNSSHMALRLLSDLKIGHYLKINPIHMVFVQFLGSFLACIVQTFVTIGIEDWFKETLFIDKDWDPNGYNTYFSAAAIWGAIGMIN